MEARKSIIHARRFPSPMADAPTLSPEVSRSVSALARTLVAAARSWALYPARPPGRSRLARPPPRRRSPRPASGQIVRLRRDPRHAARRRHRRSAAATPAPIAEAARWLHDRDILAAHLRRRRHASPRCSACSACCPRTRGSSASAAARQRSGPRTGTPRSRIEQIDFSHVLAGPRGHQPGPAQGRSVAIDRPRRPRPPPADRRGDAGAPARDLRRRRRDRRAGGRRHRAAPHDGRLADADVAGGGGRRGLSPPRRHRRRAVARAEAGGHAEPRRRDGQPESARRDADARRRRPRRQPAAGASPVPARSSPGIVDAMDDDRVAQLLATTLAIEGQASERLATVFNTIATDDDRKRACCAMTRRMLSETDFGRQDAFQSAVVVDGRAAAHLQRAAVRLGRRTGPDSTRSARAPSRWPPTCPRISWSWSTRSARTTCGGCRCGC